MISGRAIRRKLDRQDGHGGPEVDFVARYSAELLREKLLAYRDQPGREARGLLLYERDLRNVSGLLDRTPVFDQVPFAMIQQPVGRLRESLPGERYAAVISNLAFDWVEAGEFIALLDYLLKPGGVFWFSCYGSLTAHASRQLLAEADEKPHFPDYYELQDIGDALSGAGFRNVVLESSLLNLEYTSADVLLRDAERVFALNRHPDRRAGLMSPAVLQQFRRAVDKRIKAEGVYPEQVEILTAFGVKPEVPGIRGTIPVRQA